MSYSQKLQKFQDYSMIKEELSEARVVLLGEESHFDYPSMDEKVAFVKYLHDSLGFDLLLFESSLYDMNEVNEMLNNSVRTDQALFSGVYNVWHHTNAFYELAAYLEQERSSHDTLFVGGFDSQFYSGMHYLNIVNDLTSYLEEASIQKTNEYLLRLDQCIKKVGSDYSLPETFNADFFHKPTI